MGRRRANATGRPRWRRSARGRRRRRRGRRGRGLRGRRRGCRPASYSGVGARAPPPPRAEAGGSRPRATCSSATRGRRGPIGSLPRTSPPCRSSARSCATPRRRRRGCARTRPRRGDDERRVRGRSGRARGRARRPRARTSPRGSARRRARSPRTRTSPREALPRATSASRPPRTGGASRPARSTGAGARARVNARRANSSDGGARWHRESVRREGASEGRGVGRVRGGLTRERGSKPSVSHVLVRSFPAAGRTIGAPRMYC